MKRMPLPIASNQVLSLQGHQYSEKLLLEDTVLPASEHLGKVSVSTLGNFFCQYLTGHYQTLSLQSTSHIIDDGVSHLRGQLVDGTGNRKLFNDYIPLDLFMSPGRVKAFTSENLVSAVTVGNVTYPIADKSDNLFMPFEFLYMFATNTDILFYVKNDSSQTLTYDIVFHGIRILDAKTSSLHSQR